MLALFRSILQNPYAIEWIGSDSRVDIRIAMLCLELPV